MQFYFLVNSAAIAVPVVIVAIILIIIISNIRIVPQTQAYIIERLGKYHATWGTGIHMLVPFIDRVALDVSAPAYVQSKLDNPRKIGIVNLKEQVIDFDPQPVITKDNVTMQIDTVIYFQITDPKLYVYRTRHLQSSADALQYAVSRFPKIFPLLSPPKVLVIVPWVAKIFNCQICQIFTHYNQR